MRSQIMDSVRSVVIKVGSQVLTDSAGGLNEAQFRHLASQIAQIRKQSRDVVLVSSGAVSAGMGKLGLQRRPRELAHLQAVAAVGQLRLMWTYESCFKRYDLPIAQVLLTADDLKERKRHLNARNTLLRLLQQGIVPIVNENDTVAVDELTFGDNDRLSALVTNLIQADLLVMLSVVDGLHEKRGQGSSVRRGEIISEVRKVDSSIWEHCLPEKTEHGTGGIATKLEAAKSVTNAGEYMIIASGTRRKTLTDIMQGKEVGTLFYPTKGKMRGKKRWIAYFLKPKGTLRIDQGAQVAVTQKGKSLLPKGIKRALGDFRKGDTVSIVSEQGVEIARGLSNYNTEDVQKMVGYNTAEIRKMVQGPFYEEIIHRDNLVLLE